MMHKPIHLKNVRLSFPHKVCFEDFSICVAPSSRIAIIGRNGIGKSTLLNILNGTAMPTSGQVLVPSDVRRGYVPQVITEFELSSGGERLNKAMTRALCTDPNLLLLDEPTNHLDRRNRQSLMRMLKSFEGTLIVVSHDVELLENCVDTLWYIDQGKITVFSGSYSDFMQEMVRKRSSVEQELKQLERHKKMMHDALMQEQKRASKSRAKGEKSIDQRKWPTVVSHAKASRAMETSGRKKVQICTKKQELEERLEEIRLPRVIHPTFSIRSQESGSQAVVSISDGSIGYTKEPLLHRISMHITAGERVVIIGSNGSGKSSFVKAIMQDASLIVGGSWHVPSASQIGYLDQHYNTLPYGSTVVETMQQLVPKWPYQDVRRHLAAFLFCKNEEVQSRVATLSGGERARLSLAQIAAKTPGLLILDEITNNLDLETRDHMIQVLKQYPGAMIVISHDEDFLTAIDACSRYRIRDNRLLAE